MNEIKQNMIDLAVEKMFLKNLDKPANARVNKPLKDCRVALVTTAGVHLKSQEPFDGKNGDASFRVIPSDVDVADLTITHGHYDQKEAEQDVNVVLPVERIRELAELGIIESVAKQHYGFMGYAPEVKPIVEEYAPQVANMMVEDNVDIAIFSPA